MILRRRYKRKAARIEMVPLIDIVFLLLVFFIYAMLSMAVHKGMNVALPESANPERSADEAVSVSVRVVDGKATVYIDRKPVSLEELEAELRERFPAMDTNEEVLLFADKSVSYQDLYRVLDRISAAGITAISLQAEKKRP